MSEVVDVHAHVLPEFYVEAAKSAGHTVPDGMPGWPDWSPEEHIALLDRLRIDRAVLSISSPGVHFGDDRDAAALAAATDDVMSRLTVDHPGRFSFFASLALPDVGGAIAEAARALDLPGCVGVAVESNAHGLYLGDAALDPLWSELDRARSVVFIHPTAPPGWSAADAALPAPALEYLFDTTRTIVDLVAAGVPNRFPRLRFIVPHAGAVLPSLISRVEMFAAGGMLPRWADSPRWDSLWFDLAGAPVPDQLPQLIRRFGTDRLLYGSDYCFTPPGMVGALAEGLDGFAFDEVGADAVGSDRVASDGISRDSGAGRGWRDLTAANTERLFSAPICSTGAADNPTEERYER